MEQNGVFGYSYGYMIYDNSDIVQEREKGVILLNGIGLIGYLYGKIQNMIFIYNQI